MKCKKRMQGPCCLRELYVWLYSYAQYGSAGGDWCGVYRQSGTGPGR